MGRRNILVPGRKLQVPGTFDEKAPQNNFFLTFWLQMLLWQAQDLQTVFVASKIKKQ